MVRKKGGVGARGSVRARFFHPSAKIRGKWPNTHETLQVSGVLLVGMGTHRINRRDQLCYGCRLPKIDDGTIFKICVNNFKVEEAGPTPFDDEKGQQ